MRALRDHRGQGDDRDADDRAAWLIAQGVDWRAAVDAAAVEPAARARAVMAPGKAARSAALPRVMREASGAPSDLDAGLAGARGLHGGRPLPARLRRQLEAALGGADLGGVRIHTGGDADRAAQALGAHAFAVGQDIGFRAGAYDPDSERGVALIAHEVAHTRQAPGDATDAPISAPGDAAEQEADGFAASFVRARATDDDPFGMHLLEERPAASETPAAPAPVVASTTVRRAATSAFRIPEQLELTVADIDLFDYDGFAQAWQFHDGDVELFKLMVPIFDIPVTFRANLRTQANASVGGGYGPGRITGVKVTLPTSALSVAELADVGLAAERDGREGAERAARRTLPGKLLSARGKVEVPAHLHALVRGTAAIDITGGDADGIVTVGGGGELSAQARHQADVLGALAAQFLYRVHQPLALAANLSLAASFSLAFDVAGLLKLFARIDAEGARRRKAKQAPKRPQLPTLSLVRTRPPWWPSELPWILPPLDGPTSGAQRWEKMWTKRYPLLEVSDRQAWEYGLPLFVADRTPTPMPPTPAVPIRQIFDQYQQRVSSDRADLPEPIKGELPDDRGPDAGAVAAAQRSSAAAIEQAAAAIDDERAWTARALTTGGSNRAELEARTCKLEAWAASVPHLREDHAQAQAVAQFRAIEQLANELTTHTHHLRDTRPALGPAPGELARARDAARTSMEESREHLLDELRFTSIELARAEDDRRNHPPHSPEEAARLDAYLTALRDRKARCERALAAVAALGGRHQRASQDALSTDPSRRAAALDAFHAITQEADAAQDAPGAMPDRPQRDRLRNKYNARRVGDGFRGEFQDFDFAGYPTAGSRHPANMYGGNTSGVPRPAGAYQVPGPRTESGMHAPRWRREQLEPAVVQRTRELEDEWRNRGGRGVAPDQRERARADVLAQYQQRGFTLTSWAELELRDGTFEEHHIQPAYWGGGQRSPSNMVFIREDEHRRFSNFWIDREADVRRELEKDD